ncbi:hypothetical protein BN424_2350 [Carnobacterium maltaromaticum LMA28]|uniref:Uncharacterized protein n=1 Tax=Carnobacterium maltaromaticum LMA28 TaxID=1234679 RepID=K8E577_CARML|nr:hypothetical protein BN424_2350 [Carnobacterium maltaromaticum LMA28]
MGQGQEMNPLGPPVLGEAGNNSYPPTPPLSQNLKEGGTEGQKKNSHPPTPPLSQNLKEGGTKGQKQQPPKSPTNLGGLKSKKLFSYTRRTKKMRWKDESIARKLLR